MHFDRGEHIPSALTRTILYAEKIRSTWINVLGKMEAWLKCAVIKPEWRQRMTFHCLKSRASQILTHTLKNHTKVASNLPQ